MLGSLSEGGQGLPCDFSPKLYQSMKLLYNELSTYSSMGFIADVHKARPNESVVALTHCFYVGKKVEST